MNSLGVPFSLLAASLVAAIKLTVVLGLPWLAVSVLVRQSAAQRHRVWVAGVLGALLMPVLALMVPLQYSGPVGEAAARWVSRVAVTSNATATAPPVATAGLGQTTFHSNVVYLLILIWAVVLTLLALRLLVGLGRLSQIAARSKPLTDGEWTSLVAELSESLGVTRPVRILLCHNPAFIPVTWGVLRPRIVLPCDATQWSAQRRRIVLAHELSHVSRQDWLTQMCAEFMCCAYWFHPFAWVAARKLRQESERACDDAVLNVSVPASDYAKELLEIVQTLGTAGRKWAAALAIVRLSDLERRFEAMLAPSVNRSQLSRKTKLLVGVFAFLLLVPLAAFRLPAQTAGSLAPRGWLLAGSAPDNYLTGVLADAGYQGHPSAYMKGKLSATNGFGTLMQSFSASQYVGRRVRLSAFVKSEAVNDWAGLWMRVDQGSQVVAFDNMQNRSIKGTTGWQEYNVVLDVPADSTLVSFGVLLSKDGTIWLSDVRFETVGADVPVTGMPTAVPEGPRNLRFEP